MWKSIKFTCLYERNVEISQSCGMSPAWLKRVKRFELELWAGGWRLKRWRGRLRARVGPREDIASSSQESFSLRLETPKEYLLEGGKKQKQKSRNMPENAIQKMETSWHATWKYSASFAFCLCFLPFALASHSFHELMLFRTETMREM